MTDNELTRSSVGVRRLRRVATAAATMFLAAVLTSASASGVDVQPQQPPGVDKFQTILNWGGWAISVIGVVGMLTVGGTMILQHRRGEGGEHVGKLGLVLAGLLIASGAGPIVTALA